LSVAENFVQLGAANAVTQKNKSTKPQTSKKRANSRSIPAIAGACARKPRGSRLPEFETQPTHFFRPVGALGMFLLNNRGGNEVYDTNPDDLVAQRKPHARLSVGR